MTRRCGCRRRRGPDCAAAAGIGVRTARHHFIDRCESTERCATDVVWCRWVAVTRISAPRKELSPASAGLFHASVSPRALCNQLCGSALGWRLAADDLAPRRQAPSDSLDQLSPVSERGFFCGRAVVSAATINQRSGWALGWWACCISEGSCKPSMARHKMDPPSPAPLVAGLLFGDPCPLRWLSADARRIAIADSGAGRW